MRWIAWIVMAAVLLSGCAAMPPAEPAPPAAPTDPAEPVNSAPPAEAPSTGPAEPAPTAASREEQIKARGHDVLLALKANDLERLAAMVHPEKGVRFSPYACVLPGQVVFTADQIRQGKTDTHVYHWGEYDGSGKPMDLTFPQYLQRFVYNRDFLAAPQVGYNRVIRQGNTRVNLAEAYPDGLFVEYHVPGTGESADFNWASLRLVFEAQDGVWYLVGISHDQWTI